MLIEELTLQILIHQPFLRVFELLLNTPSSVEIVSRASLYPLNTLPHSLGYCCLFLCACTYDAILMDIHVRTCRYANHEALLVVTTSVTTMTYYSHLSQLSIPLISSTTATSSATTYCAELASPSTVPPSPSSCHHHHHHHRTTAMGEVTA